VQFIIKKQLDKKKAIKSIWTMFVKRNKTFSGSFKKLSY